MTVEAQTQELEIIKQLADSVSLQAKLTNRMWLATITVSFLVLFPRSSIVNGESFTHVPLGGGEVPTTTFFPLVFFILAILIVAFAAAHSQQIRANQFAQGIIDRLSYRPSGAQPDVHPRDLFDMLRVPSLTRVAPLAQLLRGKLKFVTEAEPVSKSWRRASSVLYVVLKLMTLAVFFILPGAALGYCYIRTTETGLAGPWLQVIRLTGGIAMLSLLLATAGDAVYTSKVRTFFQGKANPPTRPAI